MATAKKNMRKKNMRKKKPGSCSSAASVLATPGAAKWRKSAAGSKLARKRYAGGCKK